ncbi:uncharacterized protein METZ01_LOCUS294154 [marine metagenome]|uniref:Uncharacterized protein n=1 Tax=marine metagenome TaxID=408172 RepID=A0A382LXI1_9ZZZZ
MKTSRLMLDRLEGFAVNVLSVYGADDSSTIEKPEAVQSVTDYLIELTNVTKSDAVEVVTAYLVATSFDC